MKNTKIDCSRYILPEKLAKKDIIDTLETCFAVEETDGVNDHVALIDSFEWGLYKNNFIAFRYENNDIAIWDADELFDPDLAVLINNDNPQAKFWWDFEATAERILLEKILDLRALMTMSEGVLKIEDISLQDDNGKTQVFFELVSFYRDVSAQAPLLTQVTLTPVTGYDSEYEQACELLEKLGGFQPRLNPMDSLLSAIGVTPEPYSVKPDLSMEASMPARAAANSIISQMIEKQRLTEQGVIDDIDTEFLHHFRVALRMTRAAIAQLKEVYPEQDVLMLKERFGNLGRETNHLRDLDVFILDKPRYLTLLPDSLSAGLLPMFDDFEKDRENEVKRIGSWLSSAAYKEEMQELENLFNKGYSACETEWSERPSIELAISKITKRYKKIQKVALKISDDTPDEAIHGIRIDCKKLRYLLYFFGGLFDEKKTKLAAKQLKRLQDKLGLFNDLTVQGAYLETYLNGIEHKDKKDINLIAALGGLIATLYGMQKIERKNCIKELHIFSDEKNTLLFTQAFAAQELDI
jgi:CHAD domain-containing protein